MIEIKRLPSGQFLEFIARDIVKRKKEDLEPENMLDGKLGYMCLIFGTYLRKRDVDWLNNQYERHMVVKTTLDKARGLRYKKVIKGKDKAEQVVFYHHLLEAEAKRRGGVVIDVERAH